MQLSSPSGLVQQNTNQSKSILPGITPVTFVVLQPIQACTSSNFVPSVHVEERGTVIILREFSEISNYYQIVFLFEHVQTSIYTDYH